MKHLAPNARRLVLLTLLAASLRLAAPASAALDTWNGGGTPDGFWTNSANWGGLAPAAADQLLFDGNQQLASTNNFPAGTIFQELDFSATADLFTLYGNGFTLTNGLEAGGGIATGGSITNASSNPESLALPITLAAGRHNFATTGGGTLNLNGPITRNPGALAVFAPSSGNINVTGALTTNGFNNILGGWAFLGGDFATVDANSNVVAYTGYTPIATGAILTAPSANLEYTNDSGNLTAANGTTINSLVAANTVSNRILTITGTMKLGPRGGIYRNGATIGSTNLTVAGGSLVASGGGEITLADAPFSGTANNLIITATITNDTGNAPVSVNVLGYVQMNAANTYSAGTYVSQGRASGNNATSFGTGPVYVYPGGEAFLNANSTFTNSFCVAGIGPTETSGGQQLGAIRMNTGSTVISGPITLLGNSRISSGSGATNLLTGKITGPGRLEFTSATGTNASLILSNANNDWTGGLLLTAPATRAIFVKLGANNQIPDGPGKGDVTLNGAGSTARLDLAGFSETLNGLNAAASVANQVTNSGPGPATLALGNNNATAEFDGVLSDPHTANNLSLVKIGAGAQTLGGANTYSGATTISNGVLALGSSGSISNTAAIVVNSGAVFDVSQLGGAFALLGGQTLSGNGAIAGSLSAQTGAKIAPGFGPGTLTFSNDLTLNGCTNFFELSPFTNGANDQIVVVGSLTLNGVTTISVNPYGGVLQSGRYRLLIYGGGLVGGNANLALTGFSTNGARQTFSLDTSIANEVDLVVGGAVGALVWSGDGAANNWDSVTSNWLNGASADRFYTNDNVTFNDAGSQNPAFPVHLVGSLVPSGLTMSNTGNYIFAGNGRITGFTALNKQGSGTLTLLETGGDNFSGGITVAAGTLVLSNANTAISGGLAVNGGTALLDGSAAISGGTTIASGGTLQVGNNDPNGLLPSGVVSMNGLLLFNQSTNANVTNLITGAASGNLTKNGTNLLALSGASTFAGTVTVASGTLQVNNNSALGATNGAPAIIQPGATLDLGGPAFANNTLALGLKPINVSGFGLNSNGAIINASATWQLNGNSVGNITLLGDAALGGPGSATYGTGNNPGRWDLRSSLVNPVLSTGGNPHTLYKVGSNQVVLVNANVDSQLGNIDIRGGWLGIQDSTSLGNPASNLTVEAGATLELYQSTTTTAATLNKVFVINGNGLPYSIFDEQNKNVLSGPVTLNGACVLGGTGTSLTLSNVVSGGGSLVKAGTDNLILAATNTYTGNTLVTAGTLTLAGAGSIAHSTNITIFAGAAFSQTGPGQVLTLAAGQTLQGNGTDSGNVTVAPGATMACGTNSAFLGKLTVSGSLHLQGTNVFRIDKSSSQTNDQVAASLLFFEGGVLSLTNIGAPPLAAGDSFTLFSVSVLYSGSSFTILPALPAPGLLWDSSTLATNGVLKVISGGGPTTNANITHVTRSGSSLILGGTNNNGGQSFRYVVLASTNLALSLTNWTALSTNFFNTDGTFNYTNPIDPSQPRQFFDVKVVP